MWFAAATVCPPIVGILLGSLNLRIVGLRDYALLSLAGYYYAMVLGYSDFGSQSHLLAAYARKTPGREGDFGNALALRGLALAVLAAALWALAEAKPRSDDLYVLLALYGLALPLPSMFMEWFYNVRKEHAALFRSRAILFTTQLLLTSGWLLSGWNSPRAVPLIGVAGAFLSSIYLARAAGAGSLRRGWEAFRLATWGGMARLFARLVPVMGAQFLTPFFLAYSLPWYAMTTSDPRELGPFSIGYRLAMGLLTLVGSFVFFFIPKSTASSAGPSPWRTTAIAAAATGVLWTGTLPVLWFYYRASGTDMSLFPATLESFSILSLGLFLVAARVPSVSRCLAEGRYRAFFLIHLCACAPTLALSLIAGRHFPTSWVPWSAIVPDALATAGFLVWYGRRGLAPSGR